MEQTVPPGPLGPLELEHPPPPLGLHLMDSDKGVALPEEGLDFKDIDLSDDVSPSCEEVFPENALDFNSLLWTSGYPRGDHMLSPSGGGQSSGSHGALQSTRLGESALGEKADEPVDCTLSWLFSPSPSDLRRKTPPRDVPADDTNNLGLLISLSESSSPVKISDRTPGARTASSLLAELLSCELPSSFLNPQCSGELNPPGVSKELSLRPLTEEGALPRGGETAVSPETRDKGSLWETDPPAVGNTTPDAPPESRLSHNTVAGSPEAADRPVPSLDLGVPGRESSPGLAGHALPSEEPRRERRASAALVHDPTLEHPGEGDLSPHRPAPNCNTWTEAPSLRLLSDGDAPVLGDLPGGRRESHAPQDLMESKLLSDVKHERVEEMALDQRLTTNELHDKEVWDLKAPEGVQDHNVPDLQSEPGDGERSTDSNPLGLLDRHDEADTFGFPVRELSGSSPEPGWTSSEETAETISLSKMVVSDSMPVVSAASQREEDVSPLKAVFDALDQDGDGFVRIEEFMAFAAAYGADQVKDLTKFLDPSGLGVISFEDFHRGISAISNGGPEPQLYDVHYSPGDGAVGCSEEYDEQNEVTDSAYLGSESTYSECETFTDEDTGALVPPEMHEDVETDSGIEATLHDPEDNSNRFSLNSELHSHSLVTVIGGEEEHFEDFGESNTSELLEAGVEDEGDASLLLLHTPEQLNGSSLLSPSSGKRLSSKKVARNLLQNSTMTLDTMSDLTRNILELADNDITDKVLLLERRVAELEKESEASGEQHARLRQENLQLVHRANALEETLKEQEMHAEQSLDLEARRHKDALGKMERERGQDVEALQARLQQLDEENSELRSCVPCLRANIERLEEEKRKLQDESEDMTERLTEELEARRKMADKLSHERHQNHKEKESTQELIEDLRKQLEHLQLYKLEAEAKRGRSPSAGLQEYQTRTREAELEQEIKRLKQDNRSLKEQNDELNGQIINLSIQGAKSLLSASFSDSLAAEISSVSRGELMEAVHKQEDINYRLQDYIDKIIVAIMESNPSILEVK